MIVWTGRGYLIVLVLVASLFISLTIISKELTDYGFIFSMFITAIFSWYFGEKWNLKSQRILTDETTGKKVILNVS